MADKRLGEQSASNASNKSKHGHDSTTQPKSMIRFLVLRVCRDRRIFWHGGPNILFSFRGGKGAGILERVVEQSAVGQSSNRSQSQQSFVGRDQRQI